ncbi:MAG: acetyl-CoA hydrolase/transferase C-terminal domain-containing protein [Pseudomonadota bacterium]
MKPISKKARGNLSFKITVAYLALLLLLPCKGLGSNPVPDNRPGQNISRNTLRSKPRTGIGRFVRALTFKPKNVDAEKAASLINAGDNVFLPVGQPTSNLILKTLAQQAAAPNSRFSYKTPVQIVGLCHSASRSVFDRAGYIIPKSLFNGANSRDAVASGKGSFVPAFFHRVPRMIREGKIAVDVALVQVSKPDRFGFVTLGPTAGCTPAALEKAKVVLAQVNGEVPTTKGATRIHISQLDYLVHADEPLVPVPSAEIGKTDEQIAKHVINLVLANQQKSKHGFLPSFQFGIGGIPEAVAQKLATSPEIKSCRVHSEMIGPGTRTLVESGKVKGKVVYTFAMGDHSFLKWMHNNGKLVAKPVDIVNDPARIGKIDNVVAINSALRVDLNGQINAQYIKGMWYSGVGGQVDFLRGAARSKNGMAIIALPATAMVTDSKGQRKLVSKIVPHLNGSDVVTTSMHDVQYVVTEFGVAALEGKTEVERAKALIDIAHPDFRQELAENLTTQLAQRRRGEQKRYDMALTKTLREGVAMAKKDPIVRRALRNRKTLEAFAIPDPQASGDNMVRIIVYRRKAALVTDSIPQGQKTDQALTVPIRGASRRTLQFGDWDFRGMRAEKVAQNLIVAAKQALSEPTD